MLGWKIAFLESKKNKNFTTKGLCKRKKIGVDRMKITWLGQAGFLLEVSGVCMVIDPYLSNSIGEKNPQKNRNVPIEPRFLECKPDVICITHNHIDHLDKPSIDALLKNKTGAVLLSPLSCWNEMRKYEGQNAVLFDEETEWSVGDVLFKAVKAVHSDEKAIGVLLKAEGKTLYFTGDTLYSEKVLRAVEKEDVEAVFLPINGKGNNMNGVDAARFAKKIKAKRVYPMHYGMFDEIDPKTFSCENAVIMKVYETFEL